MEGGEEERSEKDERMRGEEERSDGPRWGCIRTERPSARTAKFMLC